ncbi:Schwannomin-interacting protein 1 [Papilio xuthus]|uniref:Schwannomin-interacting protein 1 n=1 Tax=Papilio xuthus TaxID=66420 RepID=A0A194PZG7_PAPXU|nr:Schwannomin-interacting protein 1 [Papilio xuthus]
MFEEFISNIKRRFSKPSDNIHANVDNEKTGYKHRIYLFKKKLNKSEKLNVPATTYYDDPMLSPRALGSAEYARTEIAWPIITDSNPNILDKFTKIINITDEHSLHIKKRNDREEIRKRLAMDADSEEYYSLGHTDRPGKKPSLHSRLQNGKNLQICFMNETASDNESQASDIEKNIKSASKTLPPTSIFGITQNHPYQTRPLSVNITKNDSAPLFGPKLRQSPFTLKTSKSRSTQSLNHIDIKETDFYALQARLQTEARIALAQAKEMAHIQMERERHSRAVSPVTEMLRRSMEKANAPLAPDRRRVSRQLLTDMNIAQLQVIVNELHSQIESLNDSLVKLLMARDELHMGQDSMLVDIEDLTRYLGVKEQTKKTKGTAKSGVRRLTSLVNK